MNEQIIGTLNLVQQSERLSDEEKNVIVKSLKDVDKELAVSTFKIERLEKVKHTTTVLLEQTIEELDAKRKSVEMQKRALEIEAALERVRSIAMGMRKPADMLDICQTIATELKELGINQIRNIQTAIFNDDKGTYINYEFYVKHEKALVTETEFRNHPVAVSFAEQMMKGANGFFAHSFNGAQVKDWVEYQKGTNVFIDSFLETATSLNYYWYSMGPVALGLSTYDPLSEESIALFKRFRNVFELSYRRYLDIEKAEAQARESQIQLALERVRARTMAMQKSEELKNAAALLFQQVKTLGAPAYSCGYNIWEKDDNEFTSWMSTQDGSEINAVYNIPLTDDANFIQYVESKQKNESFFVLELRDERMQEHYEYLKTIPAFKEYFDYATSVGFIPPETQIHHIANFSKGNLLFITLEPCPEYHDVFKRFAAVFEQTYTRFLDLQKAEAQAREAKIETALERIRSRSMAMQKSDELKDLIRLVNEQLVRLDVFVQHAGFIVDYKERDDMNIWLADPHEVPFQVTIPYFDCAHWNSFIDAKKTGKELFTNLLTFEEKNKFYEDLFQLIPEAPDEAKAYYLSCPGLAISTALLDNVGLYIENFSGIPYTTEENNLLIRVGKVFQQAYTRFLDLKKAEAQAREAQIEAGLERVRSRAMGMQSSEELKALIGTVFTELTKLDLVLTRCVIWIFDSKTNGANWWMANIEDPFNPKSIFVKYHEHPAYLTFLKEWRSQSLRVVYDLKGQDKIEWDRILFNETELRNLPDAIKDGMRAPDRVLLTASFNNSGALNVASLEPLSDEHFDILLRFAKVFDLTYTRFLDLQKAESQAREAKIQLALERVRARTMAMQHSDELADVAYILFQQFKQLGEDPIQITIGIFNEEENIIEFRITGGKGSGSKIEETFIASIDEPTLMNKIFRAWKLNKKSEVICLQGKELVDWISYRNSINGKYAYETKVEIGDRRYATAGFFSRGLLSISTTEALSAESIQILERFASVFDLTYTRFLDLKQAEANARESQIEAALEKVRSRSLAMQSTNELGEVAGVVSQKLKELDFGSDLGAVIIITFSESSKDHVQWAADPVQAFARPFKVPYTQHSITSDIFEAREGGVTSFSKIYPFEEKNIYFEYLFENSDYKHLPDYVKEMLLESKHYGISVAFETNSAVLIPTSTGKLLSRDETEILKRFAKVFEQSYIRFLDLEKAEASARESQIEAALEKVRGKAMAMHNSNDLSVTASMVFTELRKLGITPIRCGVGLLNEESRKAQLYSATSSIEGDGLSLVGWVLLEGHPVLEKIYDSWLKKEDYYPELGGQQLRSYYELLLAGLSVKVPDWEDGQKQYGHFFSFSIGCLYAWSVSPYNESEIRILRRFASIIDLTFRRYIELQKSEINAKEAVKQAALDRVRAEIASMRTVADLEKITPLIWNELTILGIPFIRCGVFIMDDAEQRMHTFLSTPNGEAIAAFHIPYNTPGNIEQVLNHWKEKKTFVDHWDDREFNEFAETLVRQRALSSSEQYLQTIPHGGFHLHFLPFLQGMLYVGNSTRLNEDQLRLIQSLAEAFSTAYARYEDFNKLEIAKQQVDSAFDELRATQTQLIHAEKMASLGELTAGIAHEIQNPLNFVNNFAEVSNELLDEIKSELDKGEVDEAKLIADDVKQNLEKIAHHGKRADAIVKSMLQHSRKGSGQKDRIDINSLVDEYLRMSYHGFRAKDKAFNAILETYLDPEVKAVSIIGQDIGRVLLNLFNNAFYAVNERKKAEQNGFEPTIQVTTSRLNGVIEIRVKDNGTGIPGKVLEKIYQPFFTTKPTGEGTGLGLSLSYDIITKGHGGDMKVETVEGKGSEFVIQLPNLSTL